MEGTQAGVDNNTSIHVAALTKVLPKEVSIEPLLRDGFRSINFHVDIIELISD